MRQCFMFDANFFGSIAGQELIAEFGSDGIAVYLALLSHIFQAPETKLEKSKFKAMARLVGVELSSFEIIVNWLVSEKLLTTVGTAVTNDLLVEDKSKLEAKRKQFRDNALSRGKANGVANAKPMEKPMEKPTYIERQSESTEPEPYYEHDHENELKSEHEELAPGVFVDEFTKEQATFTYANYGLTPEDMPRVAQIVSRHYDKHPNYKRTASDIISSWAIQELLKEKTAAARYIKSKAPPNTSTDDVSAAIQRLKQQGVQ
jgi:hypothetical protein